MPDEAEVRHTRRGPSSRNPQKKPNVERPESNQVELSSLKQEFVVLIVGPTPGTNCTTLFRGRQPMISNDERDGVSSRKWTGAARDFPPVHYYRAGEDVLLIRLTPLFMRLTEVVGGTGKPRGKAWSRPCGKACVECVGTGLTVPGYGVGGRGG